MVLDKIIKDCRDNKDTKIVIEQLKNNLIQIQATVQTNEEQYKKISEKIKQKLITIGDQTKVVGVYTPLGFLKLLEYLSDENTPAEIIINDITYKKEEMLQKIQTNGIILDEAHNESYIPLLIAKNWPYYNKDEESQQELERMWYDVPNMNGSPEGAYKPALFSWQIINL